MDLKKINISSLSEAITTLIQLGYDEDFKAEAETLTALHSKKSYKPNELAIVEQFRFDGMTNPADDSLLLALKADDGTRGTLVMSYGAEHNQNVELIKQIPQKESQA